MINKTKSAAEKVRQLIKQELDKTEILISHIKLIIILFLLAVYLLAPKGYQDNSHISITLVVITFYLVFLLFQMVIAHRYLHKVWTITLFIILDFVALGALIFSFHIQYHQPAFIHLKSPTFVYFFLFITIQSLRVETKFVVLSGVSAILTWIVLFCYALIESPDKITHDFIEYVNSRAILIGAELDKIIILALFTAVLTKVVKNSQDLRRESIGYYVLTEEATKRKTSSCTLKKKKRKTMFCY